MSVKRIQVKSSAGTYQVVCGTGVFRRTRREIARLGKFSSVHVLTSPKVWKALGPRAKRVFAGLPNLVVHRFDDAEGKKDLRSVNLLTRSLTRARADRQSLVIAFGGGVIGDVAGFVAASYLRGVALVQIPTTLVSQTDSSVGGKTGVNLPEGKNLVGAFYPARLVLVDPDLLSTLPGRELRGGLAEVIKYGVIADEKLFAYLEANIEKALRRDRAALTHLIRRSIEIKADVVSKDERESGLREILNFGHTFGHALESVTRYRRYQHGEAVAWGMMAASLLGHEIGAMPAVQASRVIAMVDRLGRLPDWPSVAPRKLVDAMFADKKARGGKLRFVISPRIGKAGSVDAISLETVTRVLRFAPRLARTPRERVRD